MKAKDIVIIVLLLALAVVSYLLGCRTGAQRETLRNDARFRISLYDSLYHSAESGDLRRIKSSVGVVLYGEVRTYQRQFGDVTGTNGSARSFEDAKAIADRVESQLVPIQSILPGVKMTFEKEKD